MRPKVYITRQIPEKALAIIAAVCDYRIWAEADRAVPPEVLEDAIADVDGVFTLLTERWDAPRLAKAPRLRVLASMAVGYDNINVLDCTARGVLVTNTPGVLTETTADLTWALLMATARRLPEAERTLKAGGWQTWSRGGIVDEAALYQALAAGRLWAAGLDVFATEPVPLSNPLLQLENVVALPHIGSASIGTRTRMATLAAENLVAALTGRRPPSPVNPEAWPELA